MKNRRAMSCVFPCQCKPVSGLLSASLLALATNVQAIEDPPGCSVANGGWGNTSQANITFSLPQAHVGDAVSVFPSVGMVNGACKAVNVTGTLYIATGPLINFLENATLNPGALVPCPAAGGCQPGPYNVLITPGLVGAGVSTPKGSVAGAVKTVRAVQNVDGTVQTGDPPDLLSDFRSASISIVTPNIQVAIQCAYPAGTICFPAHGPIDFAGYLTNSGDIMLTNVSVSSRAVQLFDATPPHFPLAPPLTLGPGQAIGFQGSFAPTPAEVCSGYAAQTVTVRGTDTTTIGGPNAAVTNQVTLSCAICSVRPSLTAPAYTANNQFEFNVTGLAGSSYVVQGATNLTTPNWLSLHTNTAPFTFVDGSAEEHPGRFYRAVFLPCL